VVEEGEPDKVWWLGFDCAHCDDVAPKLFRFEGIRSYAFADAKYRTFEYVKEECKQLAQQLAGQA